MVDSLGSAEVFGWTGTMRAFGLAMDLDVDLGKHTFASAGGSPSIDGSRTWTTAGLGIGWRL